MSIDSPMAFTLTIVNSCSCIFGSLGNLALITVILLHKQLHGASEILLMSLAFADLVSCSVYLPLLLIRINSNEKLPTEMNQSRRAIGQAAAVCGSLNLLMLTVDRLIFFYRPLRYNYWMRKRTVATIIMLIYGISLFVGFYAYFDMITSQYPKVALVGVPLLIFFVLHYAICRLAQVHRNQVTNQEQSLQHNYSINSSALVQARRNVRTVMLFGILYLLTWLPVTVFQLWRSVTNHHDPESFQKYFYLLLTIQQISACIDPYLCCYRNNKVKAVLRKFVQIRKYLKVQGMSSSHANTSLTSLSYGLETRVAKPAVVSEHLGNILQNKALDPSNGNTNNSESSDRILEISKNTERASSNEYESFESIYKITNNNVDFTNLSLFHSTGRESKLKEVRQSVGNNVDESLDGNKDMFCVEHPAVDKRERLENIHNSSGLETQAEDDTIHSELNTNTDLIDGQITENFSLNKFIGSQKVNNQDKEEEVDSLATNELPSNFSKTKKLSDTKQNEEKHLELSLAQSLGMEQSLEEFSEQSLESLELEEPLEQSL